MTDNPSALVIPLVAAILIVLSIVSMWILIPAPTGKRKQKLDESTTGTRNLPGLHLRNGEFVVRHDTATLAKIVWARVGGSLGTRGVRVWKSLPKEELREVGAGDLVLTNQRLLFLGVQTLTIPFDKLLKCEEMDAHLVISQSDRERPHVLVLKNAGLWCFLVNAQVHNSKIRQ
jgi:hypothetical protein